MPKVCYVHSNRDDAYTGGGGGDLIEWLCLAEYVLKCGVFFCKKRERKRNYNVQLKDLSLRKVKLKLEDNVAE